MQPNIQTSPRQGNVRAENQSLVYSVFQENDKLTIAQATELANAKSDRPITARTVRRAVEGLVKIGFLAQFNRVGNSMLYGSADGLLTNDEPEASMPFGVNNLITPAEFVHIMAGEESEPFKVKRNILRRETELKLRRMMTYALATAGNSGLDDSINQIKSNLETYLIEMRYVTSILESFVNSPIWYTHYRDMLAKQVREIEKNNPELIQLVRDFINGGE